MITRVEIPKLTLTMDNGTLVKWLKQEGESVEKDEPLFELETDKTVVEVPSPVRGLLKKIVVLAGEVSVGTAVAFIGDAADQLPDFAESPGIKSPDIRVFAPTTQPSRHEGVGSARATPAARDASVGRRRSGGPERRSGCAGVDGGSRARRRLHVAARPRRGVRAVSSGRSGAAATAIVLIGRAPHLVRVPVAFG